MTVRMLFCCLLFSISAAGQELDSLKNEQVKEHVPTLQGYFRQLQCYLDFTARSKVDSRYIEVPQKPWRIILRYKENAVNVDYENSIEDVSAGERLDWKLSFTPPLASSIGFWLGYRGTGISFSKSLAKNAGRYFSVSSTGAKYGFNFRLRRFSTDETTLSAALYEKGNLVDKITLEGRMHAPVWIRSVYINGYYVFNGRHYSQAAAYNQSVIQRRSSGSFLLGATWYQSSFDNSDRENAAFIVLGNNVHRIEIHQANIGIGYGYNFVPFRGFVVNLMAMPTFSFYNRVKAYKYDCNYTLFGGEGETDDYGTWDTLTRTWANGKTQKPLALDVGNKWLNDVDFWENGTETEYSLLHFNLDLRMGIAYNWKNYFVGAQAQLNHFFYKKDQCKVGITDGYIRISLGVRL